MSIPSVQHGSPADRRAFTARQWLALVAVLVAVKLAWLAADRTPMLFLGDSESYLETALSGWPPPDRSFLYGYLLRPLLLWPDSALVLVAAQAACSLVSALVLAGLLVTVFALPRCVAAGTAVLWAAAEPLALMYERYIMTEAFALPAFAAFVGFSLRYVERERVVDLLLANLAATLVLALRTAFVPVALAFALLLPLVAGLGRGKAPAAFPHGRRLAVALVVSILSMAGMHQLYKVIHGQVGGRVAYSPHSGLFLLAAWAPVVKAVDFADPGLGERVLAGSACPQADRFARDAQRWYPGCLVDVLAREVGGHDQASKVAGRAARRAFLRDPAGIAVLTFRSWLDGMDAERVRTGLSWDRGTRAPSTNTIALLRDRFGVADADVQHERTTPTGRWQARSVPWLVLLQASPLIALLAIAVVPRGSRRPMVFVFLLLGCMIGATALGATQVVPRYMHAVAWLAMIPLAVIAVWAIRSVRGAR